MTDHLWQPTTFLRYIETIRSSSHPAVVQTDAGRAYLKAINNPQSPHVLACDWVGTKLAQRFGLQTFDVAILELEEGDEIPLSQNILAELGPAFAAREEKGASLVSPSSLRYVQNLADLPKLIVFDTWVRNCDRYRPANENEPARINQDNLFLSEEDAEPGKFILKAIDHGHIFTCGKALQRNLADIAHIKDERLYGMFPVFRQYVTAGQIARFATAVLGKAQADLWEDLIVALPAAWQVSGAAKHALSRFLLERARFLADNIETVASQACATEFDE